MTRCHFVLYVDVCGHAPTLRTSLTITAVLVLKEMFFFIIIFVFVKDCLTENN